jgi:hypothetical protein
LVRENNGLLLISLHEWKYQLKKFIGPFREKEFTLGLGIFYREHAYLLMGWSLFIPFLKKD